MGHHITPRLQTSPTVVPPARPKIATKQTARQYTQCAHRSHNSPSQHCVADGVSCICTDRWLKLNVRSHVHPLSCFAATSWRRSATTGVDGYAGVGATGYISLGELLRRKGICKNHQDSPCHELRLALKASITLLPYHVPRLALLQSPTPPESEIQVYTAGCSFGHVRRQQGIPTWRGWLDVSNKYSMDDHNMAAAGDVLRVLLELGPYFRIRSILACLPFDMYDGSACDMVRCAHLAVDAAQSNRK